MKFQKFKLWLKTTKGASITSALSVAMLSLVIFVPIIITASSAPRGNIDAYNRDGNSGARSSFDKLVLNRGEDEKISSNVIEVSGSAIMQDRITSNPNSIGYVSAGQIINYVGSSTSEVLPKYPNDLNILNLCTYTNNSLVKECFSPSINNITNTKYKASKEFNIFFRVDKSEIVKWDFNPSPSNPNDYWEIPSSAKDEFIAGFGLYNYLMYSNEVKNILPLASGSNTRVDFGKPNGPIDQLGNKLNSNGKYDENNPLTIFTSGSTSTINSLNAALINADGEKLNDKYAFLHMLNKSLGSDIDYTTQYVINNSSHAGSGDAFKKDLGNENPSLGFLSRNVKNNEMKDWGYDDQTDLENHDVYGGWEHDAIAIFIHKDNPTFKDQGYGITDDQLRNIYLNGENMKWDMISPIQKPNN